jgi:hypothetical protein
LPSAELDQAIGNAIGDPNTCVLLADARTKRVLYRYGSSFNCGRDLPACDRPGQLSADRALALAMVNGGRAMSCPSNADASRAVGWAEGQAPSRIGNLMYSAVMEGQMALPGHEMASRLDEAFRRVRL